MVVALTHITAYISAWSLFRWYNAWIGLIPGGLALHEYQLPAGPELRRAHGLPSARSCWWRECTYCAGRATGEKRDPLSDLISLHVLNVTVWVMIGLLFFAWILPVGNGKDAIRCVAEGDGADPGPFQDLGRVFSSIDSKKGGVVHAGSTLPLQGEITSGWRGGRGGAPEAPLVPASADLRTVHVPGWKVEAPARSLPRPGPR
jgi:hypothetical protein